MTGTQSDTAASGEVQRPNIIQQGIQNFNDAIVKPVQQLFNPPQPAQPVVEPADVPVITGSPQDDQEFNEVTANIITLETKDEENSDKESSENEITSDDEENDDEQLRNVNKVSTSKIKRKQKRYCF